MNGDELISEPTGAAHPRVAYLTNLMEGLPVVLMEAMASGLPVLAPGLSGIPQLVEHRRTGLLSNVETGMTW